MAKPGALTRGTRSAARGDDRSTDNGTGPNDAKEAATMSRSSDTKSSTRSTVKQSPKKNKEKAKPAAKETKPPAKTIYSFFNAATQRQQAQRPAPAREQPKPVVDELETIQDDSDDSSSGRALTPAVLPQNSSIAIALRKRKSPLDVNGGSDLDSGPASSKFRKSNNGERISRDTTSESNAPWAERFAPTDLSELAVHKRKVAEVQQWLEMAFSSRRQRVLVLKGVAGTGKTTTVQLLSKHMGLTVVEWRDLMASDPSDSYSSNFLAQFEEFIGRAGRSGGLAMSSLASPTASLTSGEAASSRQVILVEEFPSTMSTTSNNLQSFRSVLTRFLASPVPAHATPTPVILVVSETLMSSITAAADSFTAHRLLGPELNNHPYVTVLEFNPVAPTFLVKALETVVVKEARKSGRRTTPGSQVLRHLAEAGDIRSAVSALEFLCLQGDGKDTWSGKVAFTKPKHGKRQQEMTAAEAEALKLVCNRESGLGLFHSVGKVIYNKRTEAIAPSTDEASSSESQPSRVLVPETDVDELFNDLGTDVSTFISALHENCVLSCTTSSSERSMESLSACMENLSDADLLSLDRLSSGSRTFSGSASDRIRQDELCHQVAVRGVLFSLPYPVHRGMPAGAKPGNPHKILYPNSLRLWRKQEETQDRLSLLVSDTHFSRPRDLSSSSSLRSHTAATGVESWTRASFGSTSQGHSASDTGPLQLLLAQSKTDLLLVQFPYTSQVLGAEHARDQSPLLKTLRLVTQISGDTMPPAEDEADDADEQNPRQDAIVSVSDAKSRVRLSGHGPSRLGGSKAPIKEVESDLSAGGLGNLVLDDDDIEDD